MITSMAGAGSYLRPTQAPSTTVLTRADALPATDPDANTAASAKPGIPIANLKQIDTSGLRAISIADHPELRDRIAMVWLATQAANAAAATDVPDNAPQNIYATVKVDGKVVATLYNGGSSVMTNAAAARVGDLQDPPGLDGGPDLAQARAERIAKVMGGTIEKASTAIAQSAWTPRQRVSPTYSRQQLDAAFEAMLAEGQKAMAQRLAGYSNPPATSGVYTDTNA